VTPASAEERRRTLAPFGRRRAEVVSVERVGAYTVFGARDAGGPSPVPGQFYMLATERGWGGGAGERPYLPRAFSYARAKPVADGVELDFLAEAVGPGTGRLCELEPGEGLLLTGPLGIGFAPAMSGRPLLVGGGVGSAPLLALAGELGDRARVTLGFRSAAHAEVASMFEPAPALATDDGSVGRRGLVTDLLREALGDDPLATVHACGPPAMLEAVRALCAELGVPAQLALEAGMACGFGACFGCVVPTREGYRRVCVDGPVLDAALLESALVPGSGH